VEEAFKKDDESTDGTGQARNAARDSMMLQAPLHRVKSAARNEIKLRIRNLSAGGLMADCNEPLAGGEEVVLDVRNIGEITGRVAWCHEGRVGVAFDAPIDPHQARNPVAASKRQAAPSNRPRRPGLKIS
jgi:hypothetical protein